MIDTLDQIKTPYVLMLMDDFFFTGKVDSSEIDFVIKSLQQDNSVGVCYLAPMNPIHCTLDKEITFNGHVGYNERVKIANRFTTLKDFCKPYPKKDLRGLFLVNAQAAIWNKEALQSTLNVHESAWDWEWYGTIRAFHSNYRFISVSRTRDAIIKYPFDSGNGIMQGVWVNENVEPLFKKHDIDIDLSIRGVKGKDWNYKYNKSLLKKMKTVIVDMVKLLR